MTAIKRVDNECDRDLQVYSASELFTSEPQHGIKRTNSECDRDPDRLHNIRNR